MTINFLLIVNKQGLVRVAKYFKWYNSEEKMSMEGELSRRCLSRNPGHCSFFHHMVGKKLGPLTNNKDYKVVFRKYASLYFILSVDPEENELSILEIIHLMVETLTEYFDGVSELDMLFKLDRYNFAFFSILTS